MSVAPCIHVVASCVSAGSPQRTNPTSESGSWLRVLRSLATATGLPLTVVQPCTTPCARVVQRVRDDGRRAHATGLRIGDLRERVGRHGQAATAKDVVGLLRSDRAARRVAQSLDPLVDLVGARRRRRPGEVAAAADRDDEVGAGEGCTRGVIPGRVQVLLHEDLRGVVAELRTEDGDRMARNVECFAIDQQRVAVARVTAQAAGQIAPMAGVPLPMSQPDVVVGRATGERLGRMVGQCGQGRSMRPSLG